MSEAWGIEVVRTIARDGFGTMVEGSRMGSPVWAHFIPNLQLSQIHAGWRAAGGSEINPAILPLEISAVEGGLLLVAPRAGRPLGDMLENAANVPRMPLILRTVFEAHVAAIGRGLPLGFIAPKHIFIEEKEPRRVFVFPSGWVPATPVVWAELEGRELAFLSRSVIRGIEREDIAFNLAALGWVLARGWVDFPPSGTQGAQFCREVVFGSHPLSRVTSAGAAEACLASILNGSRDDHLADARKMLRDLHRNARREDPVLLAMERESTGNLLGALSVLHRNIDSQPNVLVQLLSGRLFAKLENRPRAWRSAKQAAEIAPNLRAPWELLSALADTDADRTDALRRAVSADPIDPELRLRFAEHLLKSAMPAEALEELHQVERLTRGAPVHGSVRALAKLEQARILARAGRPDLALALAKPWTSAQHDVAVRARALAVRGLALYLERTRYRRAVLCLQKARKLEIARGLDLAPEFLDCLAHAMVAAGDVSGAIPIVETLQRMHPNQEDIVVFLERLRQTAEEEHDQ